jgi:hypothetical protein
MPGEAGDGEFQADSAQQPNGYTQRLLERSQRLAAGAVAPPQEQHAAPVRVGSPPRLSLSRTRSLPPKQATGPRGSADRLSTFCERTDPWPGAVGLPAPGLASVVKERCHPTSVAPSRRILPLAEGSIIRVAQIKSTSPGEIHVDSPVSQQLLQEAADGFYLLQARSEASAGGETASFGVREEPAVPLSPARGGLQPPAGQPPEVRGRPAPAKAVAQAPVDGSPAAAGLRPVAKLLPPAGKILSPVAASLSPTPARLPPAAASLRPEPASRSQEGTSRSPEPAARPPAAATGVETPTDLVSALPRKPYAVFFLRSAQGA